MRSSPAIAITGIGVVSPYGLGWRVLLEALSECRSGIGPLSSLPSPLSEVPTVGEVVAPIEVKGRRASRLSRTDLLAIAAAGEAGSALSQTGADRRQCAVVVASTVAGLSDIDAVAGREPAKYYRSGGLRRASTYPVSHVADSVAASLGLGGPRLGISVACASGAMALTVAARMIGEGRTPVALAGGSDALCAFTLAGFNALKALDREPCRPFCQTRAGLNLGEGAAMLLLEDLAHARARGAPVLARLAGWASTNDAFHPTAPDENGRGLAACMKQAMNAAGVSPEEVGYVNAHGTGTLLNDVAELRAYESAFAGRSTPVPVSSTKSHIGHTLGAAGAIEAAITLLSLRSGTLFPTLRLAAGLETVFVDLLGGETRPTQMETAMSASAGFGGSNTSLVFQRDQG